MRRKKNISARHVADNQDDSKAAIEQLVQGLYYPSESDEPLEYVRFGLPTDEPLNENHVRVILGKVPGTLVEEIPFAEFFEPLVATQDWYEEIDIETAKRFDTLRQYFIDHLKGAQVFRVGEVQVEIYVMGQTAVENRWEGVKTLSVET